jgi:hypothetical protein
MPTVLSFPKSPPLDMSMCIPGSTLDAQRVRSRIDEDCMFLVRMENPQGVKVDKVYALPNRPKECPPWKFAITTPAMINNEKGLLFTLKERGVFWTLEKETASSWVKVNEQIDKDFILASMEVDPSPHKLFCQELLHAEKCERESLTPSLNRQNPWPANWHSKWIDLLTETEFFEEKELNDKVLPERSCLRFPMDLSKAKELLVKLRRGAIVSMAHRCSEELLEAKESLIEKTRRKPKDKTWKSLLELCS